jgi:hypothetical protein
VGIAVDDDPDLLAALEPPPNDPESDHLAAGAALGRMLAQVAWPAARTPPPTGPFMSTPDPQLDRVRRAFDSAFRRMCAASTEADVEDELSNLLCHLYRLNELGKNRLSKDTFHKKLLDSDDLRTARAAVWARTFDAHDVVVVAPLADGFSDYYTELYGVAVWEPLARLPEQTDKWSHNRHQDYKHLLADRPVLDTTRRAFDAMAALL